ncbi:histidinol-phosphatase HisJ family protein [Clostridium chrysemydis]|uniref:histidinol-phosphatase HisJ family protein n=1 Tax=Clostridium chrysemydis TaxID=2665504 RepID=UPI0018832CE2|nr:histidinol-phosphatase HisJ family protein [Clostridium chrysemydis]
MIFDTHMHTILSSDSQMEIADLIESKNILNIGTILTEHVDFNYPDPNLFRADIDNFFKSYSKYRDSSLLLGVEIGLSSSIVEKNKNLISSYPFDYVIGSIHSIKDIDIYSFFDTNNMEKEEFFKTYFEEGIKYIKEFDDFDSLGHIDYPCRYCNYENNEFTLKEHEHYLKKLFKILIDKKKVLELNTRRLNNPKVYNALLPVYKLYKNLGGKYVTLGSDAHEAKSIGVNFKLAKRFLEETDLIPVYFQNRIMKSS